jgi:hypothetical protein
VIAERRLFLTADQERVVEEGDPAAAFLFAAPGDDISDEDAEKYGLNAPAPKAPTKEAPKPEDKQAAAPANKARAARKAK